MPRTLMPPQIDLETLERQIAEKASELNIDEREILTNSQVLLKESNERVAVLDKAGKLRRNEISRLRKMIGDLNSILDRMEAAESDGDLERRSLLAQIDILRQAGIALPE